MTLVKFRNENGLRSREKMPYFSDLFNDLFESTVATDFRRSSVPNVNIIETDESFKLEIAVPGMKKEDFKINIENDMLTVSSEAKESNNEKNKKYTRREFSYSSFMRSFTLPEMVDSEKISAVYENGVMTIELPKKEEAKPKAPREIAIS
jgi:HSP20 family protein